MSQRVDVVVVVLLEPKTLFDTRSDGAPCDGRNSPFAGSRGSAMSNHSSGDSISLRAPPDEQERARHELWLMQQQSPKFAFSRRQGSFSATWPTAPARAMAAGRRAQHLAFAFGGRAEAALGAAFSVGDTTAAFGTNWYADGHDDDSAMDGDLDEGTDLVFMETSTGGSSQRDEKRVLLEDPAG